MKISKTKFKKRISALFKEDKSSAGLDLFTDLFFWMNEETRAEKAALKMWLILMRLYQIMTPDGREYLIKEITKAQKLIDEEGDGNEFNININ